MGKAKKILLDAGVVTEGRAVLPQDAERQPLGTPINIEAPSDTGAQRQEESDDEKSDLELIAQVVVRIIQRLFSLEQRAGQK